MKKRKIVTAITSAALLALNVFGGIMPMSANAAADGGFTSAEIAASPVKPTLSASRINLTAEEAKNSPTQTISVSIKGAAFKYSSTGFHIYFDERLTLVPNARGAYATKGAAVSELSTESYSKGNCLFLATAGSKGLGEDGVMWTFQVKLPDDAKDGDKFPINITYERGTVTEDVFVDEITDKNSLLMQAWIFTKGIESGYIQIGEAAVTAGDANCDGNIDLSDAVLIMQYVANPDKYGLTGSSSAHITDQGMKNADVSGNADGVTGKDALAIQKFTLKLITALPE
ncbi:MAG: hypothetical protein IJ779_10410 [Ruminococcus sp.]|nr:hypothetical protein [Ruminococcus sp.]